MATFEGEKMNLMDCMNFNAGLVWAHVNELVEVEVAKLKLIQVYFHSSNSLVFLRTLKGVDSYSAP